MPKGMGGAYVRQHKTGVKGSNSNAPFRHDPDTFVDLWRKVPSTSTPASGDSGVGQGSNDGWDVQVKLADLKHGQSWHGFNRVEVEMKKDGDTVGAYGVGIHFKVVRK